MSQLIFFMEWNDPFSQKKSAPQFNGMHYSINLLFSDELLSPVVT